MMDSSKFSWQSTNFVIVNNADFLKIGTFIWVYHWDKIPHLGLSVNGNYFSSTVQGAQIQEPVDKFFRWIQTKATPTFFVQLDSNLNEKLWVNEFSKAMLNHDTCLLPIKNGLNLQHLEIETLSDLLVELEKENKITLIFSNQKVKQLHLKRYTKNDVLEMIHKKKNYATNR
jgi:hypothetical protein